VCRSENPVALWNHPQLATCQVRGDTPVSKNRCRPDGRRSPGKTVPINGNTGSVRLGAVLFSLQADLAGECATF